MTRNRGQKRQPKSGSDKKNSKLSFKTYDKGFLERNSGANPAWIAKSVDSPNWEFMLPELELDGAPGVVEQNPLHIKIAQ